jgi:predicted phage tail protein
MEEGNSESQDQVTAVEETHTENVQEVVQESESSNEEQKVPISAVKKERKKRQQLQQELELLKSQQKQQPQEDYSEYESVTKGELDQTKVQIAREIREADWTERYPDRVSHVQDELEEFLQQKPNLAFAIQNSTNRLKEAWELMNAFKPKKAEEPKRNKDVPRSPGTVPKSAAINETVDVMSISGS